MFIKRKITTEEDRAKAIAKAREKQRKNAPFERAKRSKQKECLRVDARLNF